MYVNAYILLYSVPVFIWINVYPCKQIQASNLLNPLASKTSGYKTLLSTPGMYLLFFTILCYFNTYSHVPV